MKKPRAEFLSERSTRLQHPWKSTADSSRFVVDKQGVIIVGQVRRLAALQLGWAEAPVHVADKLTPTS